ncbi:MAG: hypothetical protein LBQ83_07920 [Candidatus Margulisbacteria bacterium]|nr:hypothetical protein [Candidatus Margulisiibacteriota bacterium]
MTQPGIEFFTDITSKTRELAGKRSPVAQTTPHSSEYRFFRNALIRDVNTLMSNPPENKPNLV